jgi:hypothetical protein
VAQGLVGSSTSGLRPQTQILDRISAGAPTTVLLHAVLSLQASLARGGGAPGLSPEHSSVMNSPVRPGQPLLRKAVYDPANEKRGPQNWYEDVKGPPAEALPTGDVGPKLPPGERACTLACGLPLCATLHATGLMLIISAFDGVCVVLHAMWCVTPEHAARCGSTALTHALCLADAGGWRGNSTSGAVKMTNPGLPDISAPGSKPRSPAVPSRSPQRSVAGRGEVEDHVAIQQGMLPNI